ncbi:hypothetical protein Clacol_009105 [Clathrus columnatus]|uniref:Uncharacterized protein n=1 Tax=Clathrus columnatus TaxID=1419009 RepID=A0AAV5AJL5_9AGAM|nr:hypothetical protein Clacol_009105 [Clathrus columnatus]
MLLTFYRVYAIIRNVNGFRREHMMSKGTGLTELILFQTLCMSGVCVLRLFNALWFIFGPIPKTAASLGVNPFTLPIAAVFLSHFLLSLRDVKEEGEENNSSMNDLALTTLPIPIWIEPPGFELAEQLPIPPLWEEHTDGLGPPLRRSAVERWTAEFGRG